MSLITDNDQAHSAVASSNHPAQARKPASHHGHQKHAKHHGNHHSNRVEHKMAHHQKDDGGEGQATFGRPC